MTNTPRPLRSLPSYGFAVVTLLVVAIGVSFRPSRTPATIDQVEVSLLGEVAFAGDTEVSLDDIEAAWAHLQSVREDALEPVNAAAVKTRIRTTVEPGPTDSIVRVRVALPTNHPERDTLIVRQIAQRLASRWNMRGIDEHHRGKLNSMLMDLADASRQQGELSDSLQAFADEHFQAQTERQQRRQEPQRMPNPDWISASKRLDDKELELAMALRNLQEQHPRIVKLRMELDALSVRREALPREIDATQLAGSQFAYIQPTQPRTNEQSTATRTASLETHGDPLILAQFRRLSQMLEGAVDRRAAVEAALRAAADSPVQLKEVAWIEAGPARQVAAAPIGFSVAPFFGWLTIGVGLTIGCLFAGWKTSLGTRQHVQRSERQSYRAALLAAEVVLIMLTFNILLR